MLIQMPVRAGHRLLVLKLGLRPPKNSSYRILSYPSGLQAESRYQRNPKISLFNS